MKALVVIDVDNYNGWGEGFIKRFEGNRQIVASAIKETLRKARSASIPIVFVVMPHFYRKEPESAWRDKVSLGESRKYLPGFLEHRHNKEPIFFKNVCDAFENSLFAEKLRGIGVDELILVGCSTFICVKDTAKGAVLAGFKVHILENCIYPPFPDENEKKKWIVCSRLGENSIFINFVKIIDI